MLVHVSAIGEGHGSLKNPYMDSALGQADVRLLPQECTPCGGLPGSFFQIDTRSRLWARSCWTLKQIQMPLNAQTIAKAGIMVAVLNPGSAKGG